MTRGRTYRVHEVAALAGVSVRTLHHYDAIGLLVPVGRTGANFRVYDERSLLRLQQILVGRALGLSLEAIRCSLDDPSFDLQRSLRAQRRALVEQATGIARMLGAIDRALALAISTERRKDDTMNDDDLRSLFDGFDPAAHEEEAERRWGATDAFAESKKRTRAYTKEDWDALRADQAAIYDALADAMRAGETPDGSVGMDLAERHRLSIDRWFYPCAHAMHRALADMYEADERFARNIDAYGDGLTGFLSAAIRANAARHGV